MITVDECYSQLDRFNQLMQTIDLVKVGKRICYMIEHDNQDGRYNSYNYCLRVLSLLANVGGCYHHPNELNNTWGSYRDLLEQKALRAYIESLQSSNL